MVKDFRLRGFQSTHDGIARAAAYIKPEQFAHAPVKKATMRA
jgi:hypothetical protein